MIFNIPDLREDVNKLNTDLYERGTAIQTGDDLNDYTTPGSYYSGSAGTSATLINTPYTSANFKLYVLRSAAAGESDYCLQFIVTTSNGTNKIFFRNKHSGTWDNWERLILYRNVYYSANDTFSTSSSFVFNGMISDSSKVVYLPVYVDKSMQDISTVTVTACSGKLRGTDGYIDSNSNINFVDTSGYTPTASKVSEHMVILLLTKSTAYQWNGTTTNVPNNTPVSFYGSITLKFT